MFSIRRANFTLYGKIVEYLQFAFMFPDKDDNIIMNAKRL